MEKAYARAVLLRTRAFAGLEREKYAEIHFLAGRGCCEVRDFLLESGSSLLVAWRYTFRLSARPIDASAILTTLLCFHVSFFFVYNAYWYYTRRLIVKEA